MIKRIMFVRYWRFGNAVLGRMRITLYECSRAVRKESTYNNLYVSTRLYISVWIERKGFLFSIPLCGRRQDLRDARDSGRGRFLHLCSVECVFVRRRGNTRRGGGYIIILLEIPCAHYRRRSSRIYLSIYPYII